MRADAMPSPERSTPDRVLLGTCVLLLALNAAILLITVVPPHVLIPNGLFATSFGMPLLLAVGGLFFRHVRASPMLNRLTIFGNLAERRAANREMTSALTSQIPPRRRPAVVAMGLLVLGVALVSQAIAPGGAPSRGGGPTGYYLDYHGDHVAITAAQYHRDAALWQTGFAAGAILISALALIVYLAEPGQSRSWPTRQSGAEQWPDRRWPFRPADAFLRWVWQDVPAPAVVRRYGVVVLTLFSSAWAVWVGFEVLRAFVG